VNIIIKYSRGKTKYLTDRKEWRYRWIERDGEKKSIMDRQEII